MGSKGIAGRVMGLQWKEEIGEGKTRMKKKGVVESRGFGGV